MCKPVLENPHIMESVHRGNIIRKVTSLLAKTTASGCTPGEAASALSLARDLIHKYNLPVEHPKFNWPAVDAAVEAHVGEAPKPKRPYVKRGDSKTARAAAMLMGEGGALVEDLMLEFGWAPHTVRGFISHYLKRNPGVIVESMGNGITRLHKMRLTPAAT